MKVLWLSNILHGIIIANKEPLFRTSVEHRHEVLKCAPLCTDQIQIFKMMKCVHCRAFRHNSLYCIACNCCCLHWADISVIKCRCIIDYVFACVPQRQLTWNCGLWSDCESPHFLHQDQSYNVMADVPVITQQKWVAFCSPVLNEKITFKPLCGITLIPATNHCGDLLTLPYLESPVPL